MPKLISRDGSQLNLAGDDVMVGRRDATEPLIPDVDLGGLERGRTVSRRHARIFRQRSTWHLRAEQSATNVTRVAGRPLRPGEESPLTDGDEIELGAVSLTFRADADHDVTLVGRAQAPAELRVDTLAFPLAAPEGRRLWIGRRSAANPDALPDIDLTDVPGSRSVSHLHAQVYRTPAGWMLHEGKTTNPTMVAGRQLAPGEDVLLTDGVSLQLGRLRVSFHEIRPVRVVDSDILVLELEPAEISVEAGRQEVVSLRVVNATGRVEQVEVEVAGVPAEWYQIMQPDGTLGPKLRVQLVPSGPDTRDPVPDAVARTKLIFAPPRSAATRAGMYPITVSATTQGEDRVRRVVPARLRVLPFGGLDLTLTPAEAKGGRARYAIEVINEANTDVDVELTIEQADPGLICTPEPARLQLVNGSSQQASVKVRVRHHHWWGPPRTYGFHVAAISGTQRALGRALLMCSPIVPMWLQSILGKLFAMFSPIAIPAATVVLLLALAYFFLRPPDIKEFLVDPPAVAAGDSAKLSWTVDRAARVSFEPAIDGKADVPSGNLTVSPQATTEYTLTAHNWIGLSSSTKKTIGVLRVLAFKATPERLTQEKQEVTLHWETQGATGVTIEPGDEIKDPKPSGDATVHPAASTTYKLTATGLAGVQSEAQTAVAIGLPSIKKFEVTSPQPGSPVFPGGAVVLNWVGEGFSRATITASKGDVVPGQKELDATGGPPVTVRPAVAGEIEYTLTLANAAGSQQLTTKVMVTPVSITQFESDPASIVAGQPAKLRWKIEGANDTTSVTIDPEIGKVEPAGERAVSPTESTEYVLNVKGAGGTAIDRRSTVTVRAPLPVVSIFTAPRAAVVLGDEVRLTWSVQNADSVEVRTGDNQLIVKTTQLDGSVQDFPPGPTTYLLTATGASGKTTRDFSVDVRPPGAPPPAPGAPSTPAVDPVTGQPVPGAPGGAPSPGAPVVPGAPGAPAGAQPAAPPATGGAPTGGAPSAPAAPPPAPVPPAPAPTAPPAPTGASTTGAAASRPGPAAPSGAADPSQKPAVAPPRP